MQKMKTQKSIEREVVKSMTPYFKVVKRSAYGKVTNYMKKFVPDKGKISYVPTCGK